MDQRDAFLRATVANVLGNVAKIAVEGAVGLAFGSLALLADAAHSLGDLLASGVVLVWGRRRYDGPDADHPHGHGRVESLTALFVGATLLALAVMLFRDSVRSILEGASVTFDPALVAGLAFAVVSMAAVYRYTVRMNEVAESPALRALAVDCRNDVYTSFAAVAGVAGAWLGYAALDAVAGAFVSLLVAWQGVEVARENIAHLVGAAPGPERRAAVRERVLEHDAVRGVHDLQVFYNGPELEVEFHAEVDGDISLRAAHDVETDLVTALRDLDGVGDAHVHLDPSGMGEWEDAEDPEHADPDRARLTP